MEVVLAPAQPDGLLAAFGPKEPCGFGDRRFTSPSQLTNGDDLFYGYSSPSSPFGLASVLSTPSPCAASLSRGSSDSGSVVDDGDDAAAAADRRHRLARLALQYQEVLARFELCLSYLADASNEAAALRRENDELRVANEDLARRIKMVGDKLADEFSGLRLAEGHGHPTPLRPLAPLPVVPALPKSISVRSPGYLKMNQNGKHRPSKPTKLGSRVFVGMDGSVKEDGERKGGEEKKLNSGLEFEVYSQGTLKTELCNKWEETGACPYGDQCQFAHGIAELRPVIRHPRYKTEICRMVLAGVLCPYGHRCHFRHSVSPADLFPQHDV
ncbi:zinc finger CCCH domain-containing protein 39 isoform X2 [Setaria viridis]|uniref:C3H1-type domain-containing protein n=1 Tax=Setaria viridis TaxID=4556 RepID=A0A4U6VMU0_SETVI|nr:hypothetical protein SEVIR_3G138700v2 [Setaria viridis]